MGLLADLRYRRQHRRMADDAPRLVVLTDLPYRDYCGYMTWCDGRRRRCDICGGRCCACHHRQTPPGGIRG